MMLVFSFANEKKKIIEISGPLKINYQNENQYNDLFGEERFSRRIARRIKKDIKLKGQYPGLRHHLSNFYVDHNLLQSGLVESKQHFHNSKI